MRVARSVELVAWSLLVLTSDAASAAEPWVDANLKIREGLVAWLDAAAQPAARSANKSAPIQPGEPAAVCFDGARGSRFTAADAADAPSFQTHRDTPFLRFDGRRQYLAADLRSGETKTGLEFDDVTVFVVAAPFHNEGDFPGMVSMHAWDAADYVTGINIDQGFDPTKLFEAVNVEGAGSGGLKNLRTRRGDFATFHRIGVTSQVGPQGVSLYVDGVAEGSRERIASKLKADRIILGGRFTDNASGIRCFFAGDIAEALVYDRILTHDELQEVDAYLAAKYDGAGRLPPPPDTPGMRNLKQVDSPPPVQMHVPGFVVRELPVQLPNINNVLYREDGVLVALAYDGDIYHLRDTNNDGLEDEAKLFWKNEGQLRSPVGMALTPPNYAHGRGIVVPSKAKCSLVLDVDGDDQADKEIVIAEGWPELPVRVDALGVDFDPKDHSIYFGLGTTDFSNAHLVDQDGVGHYDLKGEHGTILRIAPDLKSRKIFATGIRFPVAIRFNKHGDLFCTDQEGATWLPNGNPFDELLQVREGRHYGFPPRHPRHLPNVIDEPSLFDFRPQHQSTCGLNFNDPSSDGTIFGPEWWKSDALITGFSRGKLYRTKLATTPDGYIAQNQLIGTTNMMPSDICVGPRASAVVATHSGGPDWGTGPAGVGKLYKVTYQPSEDAIPSLIWSQSPQEVRVSFDRQLNPDRLKDLGKRIQIDAGENVAAADRFESFRPGYAVVRQQRTMPRRSVKVQSVQLTPDRRSLIVTTDASAATANYSIALHGMASSETAAGVAPQYPDIDLQYDHSGAEVTWRPEEGEGWAGWLPHFDLGAARQLTLASAEHDVLWERMRTAGTIGFRTTLDLRSLLHPAVQPGAKLDYDPPAEEVTLSITSSTPETYLAIDGQPGHWMGADGVGVEVRYRLKPGTESIPVEIQLRHAGGEELPKLTVRYHTSEDPRPRDFPLNRLRLQWSRPETGERAEIVENRDLPELEGGNWLRGEKEFFGATAGCSKCHTMRGVGGAIGPDLSNLPQRDYASVFRDVTQPSYAINPDFVAQTVQLQDGRTMAGTVRIDGDQAIIADQEGKETVVPRTEIESLQHSAQSIMPEGIPQALGPARVRDLLTYLLVAPPTMPVYGKMAPPPPRRMAEVDSVLNGSAPPSSNRSLHIVLVAGAKDHGPGEHDYPAWKEVWRQLLEMAEGVRVSTADDWPSAEDLKSADALVFFQKGAWNAARANDLDAFLKHGGGVSYIHYAVSGGKEAPGFAERIGLAWNDAFPQYRHGPLDLDFTPGKEHPVGRNFDKVHFYDESYWNSVGDPARISLLATGVEEGKPQPLLWTREHGGGRIFVSVPGHYSWTFDDPLFRVLLLRGLAWTANEPVDRFNDLVLPGARVRHPADKDVP